MKSQDAESPVFKTFYPTLSYLLYEFTNTLDQNRFIKEKVIPQKPWHLAVIFSISRQLEQACRQPQFDAEWKKRLEQYAEDLNSRRYLEQPRYLTTLSRLHTLDVLIGYDLYELSGMPKHYLAICESHLENLSLFREENKEELLGALRIFLKYAYVLLPKEDYQLFEALLNTQQILSDAAGWLQAMVLSLSKIKTAYLHRAERRGSYHAMLSLSNSDMSALAPYFKNDSLEKEVNEPELLFQMLNRGTRAVSLYGTPGCWLVSEILYATSWYYSLQHNQDALDSCSQQMLIFLHLGLLLGPHCRQEILFAYHGKEIPLQSFIASDPEKAFQKAIQFARGGHIDEIKAKDDAEAELQEFLMMPAGGCLTTSNSQEYLPHPPSTRS